MKMKNAFTLIELLVVIAIIALLAALLFPTFAASRGKARQIVCVSNLKELGMAMAMYTTDNDERFPLGHTPAADPLTQTDSGDYEMHQVDLLRPYIKNTKNQGIWRCPGDPSAPVATQDGVSEFRVSYSVNAWFEYGASLASVEKPSEKVYFLESTDDDHFHWWELGHPGKSSPILPLSQIPIKQLEEQVALRRHHKGENYLYTDGHAKWAHFASLWGITQSTNAFWP